MRDAGLFGSDAGMRGEGVESVQPFQRLRRGGRCVSPPSIRSDAAAMPATAGCVIAENHVTADICLACREVRPTGPMQRVADLRVEDAEGVSAGQLFRFFEQRLEPILVPGEHRENGEPSKRHRTQARLARLLDAAQLYPDLPRPLPSVP